MNLGKLKVVVDDGCFVPEKAHLEDAGYDLRTPYGFQLFPGCSEEIDTGVHIQLPRGFVGMIKSKSGLNVKRDLISEGVIDCGYTGSIVVKLRNLGDRVQEFSKGDKITQLVVLPCMHFEVDIVDKLEDTERGSGGFGSSGR